MNLSTATIDELEAEQTRIRDRLRRMDIKQQRTEAERLNRQFSGITAELARRRKAECA